MQLTIWIFTKLPNDVFLNLTWSHLSFDTQLELIQFQTTTIFRAQPRTNKLTTSFHAKFSNQIFKTWWRLLKTHASPPALSPSPACSSSGVPIMSIQIFFKIIFNGLNFRESFHYFYIGIDKIRNYIFEFARRYPEIWDLRLPPANMC